MTRRRLTRVWACRLDKMDLTGLRSKWKPVDEEVARYEADALSIRKTFGDRVKGAAKNVWQ